LTWSELLELWRSQTLARIEIEVKRFDERLAADGASLEQRQRVAAELREHLMESTDLGLLSRPQ